MAKKTKKKMSAMAKILVGVISILSILAVIICIFLELVPLKYLIPVIGLLTVNIIIIDIFFRRKKKKKTGTYIVSIIYIACLSIFLYYAINTLGFLRALGKNNFKQEDYLVIVLKSSSFDSLNDLENNTIGILKDDSKGKNKALNDIQGKIELNRKDYLDTSSLADALLQKKIHAILIENAQAEMLYEINPEFKNLTKVIFNISIKIKNKEKVKKIDFTKDFFNIYVSGIDTYGSVNNVARSDVNLVLSVNPKTHQVLITSIPRDYYVTLSGKNKFKDKLTHAGIYGVETSINTIEKLLDTKIDYYVKVNFSSLIKIVDTLGGVEVDSKYAFTSIDGYKYNKGKNYLNGKKALSFVRERHAFDSLGGDRVRGENQQLVLKALIEKAITPQTLVKYSAILSSVKSSFITNIDRSDIANLISDQIENASAWNIETFSLDGKNGYEYTYSYQSQKLYVMIPDEKSVGEAKDKIKLLSE